MVYKQPSTAHRTTRNGVLRFQLVFLISFSTFHTICMYRFGLLTNILHFAHGLQPRVFRDGRLKTVLFFAFALFFSLLLLNAHYSCACYTLTRCIYHFHTFICSNANHFCPKIQSSILAHIRFLIVSFSSILDFLFFYIHILCSYVSV